MTLLQIIISLSCVVFFFFGIDLYKRRKTTILHFLVFIGGGAFLLLLTFYPNLLNKIGDIVGADGANLIVYISIITLTYIAIGLYNKILKTNIMQTQLARHYAIQHRIGSIIHKDVVFIIPAYHEDEHVIHVVNDILDAGYGVVLVNDELKSSIQKQLQNIANQKSMVIINHPMNMGQGASLQTGHNYILQYLSETKYVVHFDADGQHRLEDLKEFQHAFKKNPDLDIVLGSRFLGEAKNIPWVKKLALKIGGVGFTRFVSNIKLTDAHNGYRMIKVSALSKLCLTMNDFTHASEIIDLIKQHKLKYQEVPITVLYTDYSINKGQKLSNAFRIVKNILYKKLFFR